MPLITETTDILGYADESWWPPARRDAPHAFAVVLADIIDRQGKPFEEWPVRNHEAPASIDPVKRAIVHERDGGTCRYCGVDNQERTVDHIIPRAAFPPDQLHIADRSDNLISVCQPCIDGKGLSERDQRKRLGVTAACWYCAGDDHDDSPQRLAKLVYCGTCGGISRIPTIQGWVL